MTPAASWLVLLVASVVNVAADTAAIAASVVLGLMDLLFDRVKRFADSGIAGAE